MYDEINVANRQSKCVQIFRLIRALIFLRIRARSQFSMLERARQLAASIFAGVKKNQGSISDGGMGDRDRRCAGQIRPKSAIMVMEGSLLKRNFGSCYNTIPLREASALPMIIADGLADRRAGSGRLRSY